MAGAREKLAHIVVFVFTRIVCPVMLVVRGVGGYASCMLRGMRMVARLVRVCDETTSLIAQSVTLSMLLYTSLVARILGVSGKLVIVATASGWRTVMEQTRALAYALGRSVGCVQQSKPEEPTMFT